VLNDSLTTEAERLAEATESLVAFSGFKLSHVKRDLAKLLSLIGREGIFDEYTCHDISHINAMLQSLDWIVSDKTKSEMSAADWLLLVLAVYFHDIGMLVTRREFDARARTEFPSFVDRLFAGPNGLDYQAEVEKLPADRKDRFLYQEFVRSKHAERVRDWIQGKISDDIGISSDVLGQIDGLLAKLPARFRKDLSLVCESHHLDDLDDFRKYPVSQPYGNSPQDTGNVQFVAIALRTADLLHATSDRTPSVLFHTINPTNPTSQQEWAKQRAVSAVRAQLGRDKDGLPDKTAPRNVVEVHALFTNENGFFGLTSYLRYVEEQLKKSFEWAQLAVKTQASRHEFPWRYIDSTRVEAQGFIPQPFEFTLDQAKILDLLIGHTLYNDTSVVLRELVQNALDAVRLQRHLEEEGGTKAGNLAVRISWDSSTRVLTVEDNGTGMTQEIVERHFLKVGSSRYQDSEFRKRHPTFSSISRFGIGVLSAFMISDEVEITTCSELEEEGRHLSLRSVHGKYLVRTLARNSKELNALGVHGTRICLRVRASAKMGDIETVARRWIVIPDCDVQLSVDSKPSTKIGNSSVGEALRASLSRADLLDPGKVKVIEKTVGDVAIAFAVKWSEWFQKWDFLLNNSRSDEVHCGICVEGIRVEFDAPGFRNAQLLALANCVGSNAPRTNVARSGLEVTQEREAALQNVYRGYCAHVEDEQRELVETRNFASGWATQECLFMVEHLLQGGSPVGGPGEVASMDGLMRAASDLKIWPVESGEERRLISAEVLRAKESFWTVDGAFFKSAEELFREVRSERSLGALINALGVGGLELPDGPILCLPTFGRSAFGIAFDNREVDRISVSKSQRRVDLRWRPSQARWVDCSAFMDDRGRNRAFLAREPVEVVGLDDEGAIVTRGIYLLLSTDPITTLLIELHESAVKHSNDLSRFAFARVLDAAVNWFSRRRDDIGPAGRRGRPLTEANVQEMINIPSAILEKIEHLRLADVTAAFNASTGKAFDPSAWARGSG